MCGEALSNPGDAFYGLCAGCRFFLESAITNGERCSVCGKPLISEKGTCLPCREPVSAEGGNYRERLTGMRVLFPYTGKFKATLGAFKFGKSLGVGNFFASHLRSIPDDLGLEAAPSKNNAECAWVPVPPRPGKIRRQGWDQIERLALLLERYYKRSPGGKPVCRCLKRLPSRSQKELNREERGSNLNGRILCTGKPPKSAILFDDVITTGATLNACAAALLEGGAEKVYGVCLFYD